MSRTSGSHSQQPGLATEDVLDRTVALAQMGADVHLVVEMAGVLLQDCPKQLSAIRAAVALDDSRVVERAGTQTERLATHVSGQRSLRSRLGA